MSLPLNQVVVGDCTEVMRGWPADSIDLVVTSPPYWGLRDYGEETVKVWGGLPECEHEWEEIVKHRSAGGPQVPQSIWQNNVSIVEAQRDNISNFCSKCGAWRGSLGLEPHPQMFIDSIVEICREVKRVLKPTGTFWLNLGDTYASMKGKAYNPGGGVTSLPQDAFKELTKDRNPNRMLKPDSGWLQPKQKLMIPARVAIALQDDGWILRSDVIWHKPNAMPSSVKDRLSNAYEHVFLFVKNNEAIYWVDRFTGQLTASKPTQYYVHDETGVKRLDRPKREVDKDWFNENGTTKFKYAWQGHDYYFDLDAIRVPHSTSTIQRITQPNVMNQPGGDKQRELRGEGGGNASRSADMVKSLARKLIKHDLAVSREDRSYTDPLHERAYDLKGKNPGDVLSGSKYLEQDHPHSIRVKGGHTGDYTHPRGKNPGDFWSVPTRPFPGAHFATFPPNLIEPIVKAGSPKGGVVLDPFGGSGTVGQVARKLGRRFILIEIIPEYCKMAEQRVRGKYKPVPEGVTQLDQFMEAEE